MAAGALSSCSPSLLWQIRECRGGGEEYEDGNSQRSDPGDPLQKATPPTPKIPRLPPKTIPSSKPNVHIGEAVRDISHSSHQIERSPFCVTMTSKNESNDVGNFMII